MLDPARETSPFPGKSRVATRRVFSDPAETACPHFTLRLHNPKKRPVASRQRQTPGPCCPRSAQQTPECAGSGRDQNPPATGSHPKTSHSHKPTHKRCPTRAGQRPPSAAPPMSEIERGRNRFRGAQPAPCPVFPLGLLLALDPQESRDVAGATLARPRPSGSNPDRSLHR